MTADIVPWPQEDIDRYRAAGYWRGETYPEFLDRQAATYGSHTAVIDDHIRLTYTEFKHRADTVARGLHTTGIRAGDRVLVQLPNRAEFLVLWFALMRVGAIPVHAQPGHRHSELIHLAEVSEARAYVIPDVFTRFDYRQLARTVQAACPTIEHVIVVGEAEEFIPFDELTQTADGPAVTSPAQSGDLAVLLLSGGTTGRPKLIPRTHDDYLYNGRAAAEVCQLDEDTVYLAVLPVAFNYTMNCPGVLGALSVGGTVVLASTPDPDYCFERIARVGVTIAAINPQLAPLWLEEARATTWDISSLRVLQIGSARLSDGVAQQVIEEFDCTIQQVFGMAEGLLCLSRLDDTVEIRSTTQGKPISEADEIRVVDSELIDVPDGEEGELLTKGPYTLRGYYRAPEHNAKSFHDGYYRSGDLVRRTSSGHLIVVGRSKDQINRGGLKIAAPEVEGHLQAHPRIQSAALLPAPDPDLGERSVLFLVPAGSSAPTRAEIAAYLTERGLAAYKVPDDVHEITEMPLTPVGKMDKNTLARRLEQVADA